MTMNGYEQLDGPEMVRIVRTMSDRLGQAAGVLAVLAINLERLKVDKARKMGVIEAALLEEDHWASLFHVKPGTSKSRLIQILGRDLGYPYPVRSVMEEMFGGPGKGTLETFQNIIESLEDAIIRYNLPFRIFVDHLGTIPHITMATGERIVLPSAPEGKDGNAQSERQ